MRIIKITGTLLLGYLWLLGCICNAQPLTPGKEHLFTTPENYIIHFTSEAPTIDGNLKEEVWQAAKWTEYFADIEGNKKLKPAWNTQVKMVWNDTCLFIAAQLQEPHVWATLKQHDAIIYHDNDFEVFIDPDNDTHSYYEIEVNAFNTIFDLFMTRPYRNGGQAIIPWRADGLRSAVQVQGTINNPNDTDKSWTVEMAIPLQILSFSGKPKFPEEGTTWRINFSRVQWDTVVKQGKYVKVTGVNGEPLPEHNWVWSPQGVINMHYPERWGYLFFTRKPASSSSLLSFSLPYTEKQKHYLWQIYYQQKEYFQKYRHYAGTLIDLGIANSQVIVEKQLNKITLEASTYQFMAFIQGTDNLIQSINQDGLIQTFRN